MLKFLTLLLRQYWKKLKDVLIYSNKILKQQASE
jgi:hypothetical protein